MNIQEHNISGHYSVNNLRNHIFGALDELGVDLKNLRPEDLSPIDEFHIRGLESTKELAGKLDLSPDMKVLDVGCGLGGSCRYLSHTFGADSTGIDLTPVYCDLAMEFSTMTGLEKKNSFHCCSANELPYEDDSFDVVWTEHVQMNIEDKSKFYGELKRVLKPGGKLAFHDIFSDEPDRVLYPAPWADNESISYLYGQNMAGELIESLGFEEISWSDMTEKSAVWFQGLLNKIKNEGPPKLGIHLLMGVSAKEKIMNLVRNLVENRVQVVQAVFRKD